ncbi:MAG: hypothetical protein K2M00_08515 [Muribaculaceae bacterium]|nr:hypothetical protein [Muribaculaceae bacterium]
MDLEDIRERIADIAAASDEKLENRIERLLALGEEVSSIADEAESKEDEKAAAEISALIYETIIDLLDEAGAGDTPDMLYACVLLAEAYDTLDRYRPIGMLARKMLNVDIDSDDLDPEVVEGAYSRMADVLEDTVYYRDYIRVVREIMDLRIKYGKPLEPIKSDIKRYLAITVLTGGTDPFDRFKPSPELQALFSPAELLDIILHPRVGHLRVDPVEFTERWEKIYYDLSDELDRLLADEPRRMGYCFMYWEAKARLLRKAYGIEWRSPRAMNPGVMFY